ncbi:MAG: mandelate racemase/muconate lactonizing enzyme family protein, partial [Proteobacteria bacterium]|nr:mandelate racemase/muconate lactonizing enzyme family protein [Pseudomonadota bacterium]
MKIKDVESFPVSYQLERPFANSAERHQRRSTTLVKITTDEGIAGWGEAYGPPLGVSRFIQTYLKPRLVGEDPLRLEYLWFKLQTHKGIPKGAMGGIDLALWDLKARAMNVPVYELLGGRNSAVITPYATGFFFSEDEPDSTRYLEAEVEEALSKKFRALKMKIGFGKDRDIKRMRRVRELVSDGIDIMADANQAYDFMTCIELIPFL